MKTTQNRKPPAYQEYASEMLASASFRLLNLNARGLLYTLRLECWTNGSLPAAPVKLARILGLDAHDVESALHDLGTFFDISDERLTCAELEDYRAYLSGVRERQSAGGKKGAAQTNAPKKSAPHGKVKSVARDSTGHSRVASGSLVESSKAESSTAQQKAVPLQAVDDDFVKDYERASNGF